MDELRFLEPLISVFEKLPGVGRKSATRYAFYLVEKFSDEDIEEAIKAISEVHDNIKHCSKCNILTDKEVCDICNNPVRDSSKILVVRDTKDVISLERTKQYNGLYHVLGGLISPLDGVGPDDINVDSLENRLKKDDIQEVILATSFTPQGETTALYLERILKKEGLTITRIGYGIPAGGDIEYADELTLQKALESRNKI